MIARIARALARQDGGNATIELALVAPVLLTMALGVIDLAMGFSHKMQMQHYAQVGADYVVATLETNPQASDVKDEVANASGLDKGKISISEWVECDGVKNPNETQCAKIDALQYNFMQIDVSDTYQPMLDIPGLADYVGNTRNVGSVTVRTK